jgi:two-component system chemotaxis sensor kinase CheA
MDSNQKRFAEDALDLLNDLDEGLLQLEANPQASAPLEQVFRTMHTIKGGANMFGFENIGELAHHLETLYDLIRQGRMQVNDGLISLTLHAFDKVRDLLKEDDVAKITNAENLKGHLHSIMQFLAVAEAETKDASLVSVSNSSKDELATFFIRVSPTIKMTADGNHPLVFILQDLEALGTAKVFVYKDEDGNVKHWDAYLSTTTALPEIESYFLFVENECQVSYIKLLGNDLFGSDAFKQFIETGIDTPIKKEDVIEFVDQIADSFTNQEVTE